jgi:hypothetical protein
MGKDVARKRDDLLGPGVDCPPYLLFYCLFG